MSLTTKIAAAVVAAAVPMVLATAPAEAGSRWTERSSGSFAEASWLEMGALDGVAGNIHVGYLRAEGDRNISLNGDITDWTCPQGVMPPMYGGEEPSECVMESQRYVYNSGAATLRMDRKLTSATLTAPVVIGQWDDNGAGSSTEATANITWTGVGGATTVTTYEKYTDGDGNRYTLRRTENARQGNLSGSLGDMTFGDDADDQSWGYFGTFKTASTSVSP